MAFPRTLDAATVPCKGHRNKACSIRRAGALNYHILLTESAMCTSLRYCFVVLVVLGANAVNAACSRDDAFNKMMALSQYGMKLHAALPDPLKDAAGYNASYKRVIDFNSRLGDVGKTLAAQQYDQACATYDALAAEYHVDMAGQRVRPMAEVEAGAKKPPRGKCDLAEAARRSMWLTESFQKHAEAQHLDRDAWQRFGKETEPVGLLMQQDPNEACGLIDDVAAKYGFKR